MLTQAEIVEELQMMDRKIPSRETTPTKASPAIAISRCATRDRDADAYTEYYCTYFKESVDRFSYPTKLQQCATLTLSPAAASADVTFAAREAIRNRK